ncbi:uncharacterized protein LTR77_000742 [Saxophila tyrrhenica]|uniref:Uncharacterized protein n=1 Tax=Saxophila tyrrhenica TaxID=1690608 RepID=A0AAV9PTD0_9PEZI|nr:hypothetical protein LTR77_000742 [Saxophila tyrrhenica]
MSQLRQKLGEAAGRNHELLAVLTESDYAAPALKQNTSYISDLKSQITETDKTINRLHASTEKERKEHVKVRDSVMRRYASKLQGHKGQEKFSAKQDKEEREFLEAWQQEREAQERREELGRALEEAEKEKKSLESDSAKHDEAQRELDQLYQNIFGGPTPEVPGEDELEQALSRNRDYYQQCQQQAGRDKQAAQTLEQARGRLGQAVNNMHDSLQASNFDRFGGGALFDLMERDALSKAQMNYNWCKQAMADAARAQPAIPPLGEVAIDHGHVLGDIMFDNIFSDFAQHDRIRNSAMQMQQAMNHLQSIIKEQKGRVQDAQRLEKTALQQLEDSRIELQKIRSEAFERLAGEGGQGAVGGDAKLPAYSA